MKQLLHRSISLLLTAAVLAGAVLPPAVGHAHVGGDESHSHEQEHAYDDHVHHHAHQHVDEGHGDDRNGDDVFGSSVPHLHLSVAGFNFSLPLPIDGHSHRPFLPMNDDVGVFAVVSLTDDFTIVSQVDLATIVDVSVADVVTSDVSTDEDDARARWLKGRADRIFLCDSARCERSGVLLI